MTLGALKKESDIFGSNNYLYKVCCECQRTSIATLKKTS